MFLLVPAYPGCPGSKAVKRSLLLLLLSRGNMICPLPIKADLRPCADKSVKSAVRTAMVAWPGHTVGAARLAGLGTRPGGTDRRTDRGIA